MTGVYKRSQYYWKGSERVSAFRRVALSTMLFILLVWVAPGHTYTDSLDTPAIKSEAAQFSLLLDIERAGSRLVVVGERGHILYSEDQGKSWTQADVPSMAHMNAVHFPTPEKGWAVGEDKAILHSTDGGKSWVLQYDERDARDAAPLLDVIFFDEQNGLSIGAYGTMLETTDGGRSWDDVRDRIENLDDWHYSSLASSSGGALFIAGEAGFVYRSMDKGQTWETIEVPHEGSFLGGLATRNNEQLVVFGIGGYVFVTDDAGQSWREVEVDTKAGFSGGALLEDGRLLIVGGDGVMLVGDSEARKFTIHTREDRLPLANVIEAKSGEFIVVGIAGILPMTADELAAMAKN